MSSRGGMSQGLLYALFVLSGVAGLIYESIWTHYLKLFLGHAAYAQTLVLAIFMGGMAIGAWLAGDLARRVARPLLWYAAIEGLLGVAGLGFHTVFGGMQGWIFDSVIPRLDSSSAVDAVKWTFSTLLILPQSILLGATFPMMSAGVVRRNPMIAGRPLAWLYFTNSIGASAGVLLSGYFLIDRVGLPGTLLTAAMTNFLLALGVYVIGRCSPAPALSMAAPPGPGSGAPPRLILAAAFLTGAASFFYEIGWIRMLSLVLGSATHSFELMLSAFIFGLATGAWWIRNRIDTLQSPLRALGWIQACMASAALLTLVFYMQSFEAMAWFRNSVEANDGGYVLFTLFSSSLCFVLMLPATFFAGMTLPLMTAMLLRAGHGEASIGRVYAANTVGAIVGILLAVHVFMPVLGLRQVVLAGALIDLALGIWLLHRASSRWSRPQGIAVAAIGALALSIAAVVRFDPAVTASGAYRLGTARVDGEVLFHADGKTATVDVTRDRAGVLSIATNGKIDAGRSIDGPPLSDDYTMGMLSLLPMAMLPDAKRVAVIGMGSGTSTDVLLRNPRLQQVDTIEIEPAMVEGAKLYRGATHRVYDDPRSRIHIEDAKTYFSRAGERYDMILSEPSNPWVSGISSLFSREFYTQIKRHINDDGVFVQWLHLYEINMPMVATVMNALAENFDDYLIYSSNDSDIIIIAKARGRVPQLLPRIFEEPGLKDVLHHLDFNSVTDLEWRRIGGKSSLAPYFRLIEARTNSDYFPVLDQLAGRQRFVNAGAGELLDLQAYAMRVEQRQALQATAPAVPALIQRLPGAALRGRAMAGYYLGDTGGIGLMKPYQIGDASILARAGECSAPGAIKAWQDGLKTLVVESAAYLTVETAGRISPGLRKHPCAPAGDGAGMEWIGILEGIGLRKPELILAVAPRLAHRYQGDMRTVQFLLSELLLAQLQSKGASAAANTAARIQGVPASSAMSYLAAYAAFQMQQPAQAVDALVK